MRYCTTFDLHLKVLNIWNKLGLSPLHVVAVTRSKTEVHEDLQQNESKSSKVGPDLGLISLHCNDSPTKEESCKFPIHKIEGYRSAGPQFLLMFCFLISTLFYSIIKLGLFVWSQSQSKKEADVDGNDDHRTRRTLFLVGSVVWISYACTCCVVYTVNLFKTDKLCSLLVKWQIVEGELISESKAMKASLGLGETVESFVETYINLHKKRLKFFILGMVISFIFLACGTTFFDDFPMNMFSTIPKDWVDGRLWIKPLCWGFSWLQVGIFLLCESQSEVVAMSFVRSILRCLKILNKPAIDFYARHCRNKIPYHLETIPTSNWNSESTVKNRKLELSEIFHDSVERFESLKNLIDEFNSIFRWPLFSRQAFTMVKVCCYVYLLLRHPIDTGFPGAIIFCYASVAIFIKFGVVLSIMGAVRAESEKFIKEWRKALLVMFPSQKVEEERRLKCCYPFGFRLGVFYTVKSQTPLTFCSVVLTYLIILLQLQFFT